MINLNISLPAGPSRKAADWCGPSVRVNVSQSDSSRLIITEASLVELGWNSDIISGDISADG